jgi:aspartate ammonia-lyase
MISHLFLKSIVLLISSINSFSEICVDGIKANRERCISNLINSSAVAAFLIGEYGYDEISEIVNKACESKNTFLDELKKSRIISEEKLIELIGTKMGIINE